MTLNFEHLETIEEVHQAIMNCEGKHTQQTCFSTFHDCLTQICFGCKAIRSNLVCEEEAENVIQ